MTDALREALLPCPFCEGPAVLDSDQSDPELNLYWVGCAHCFVQTVSSTNPERPIALWNRRTALQEPAPAVAREPTEAMLQRFHPANRARAAEYWRAMYDAAPQAPVEPAPVVQPEASERLRKTIPARPLNGTLDDYWVAPGGEGPLAYTWSDKPTRLLYDLIGAVLYYAAPSQLVEDARAKAIEECAKECEALAGIKVLDKWGERPSSPTDCARAIRSIAKGVES